VLRLSRFASSRVLENSFRKDFLGQNTLLALMRNQIDAARKTRFTAAHDFTVRIATNWWMT
jgi:hypothetical protein